MSQLQFSSVHLWSVVQRPSSIDRYESDTIPHAINMLTASDIDKLRITTLVCDVVCLGI